MKFILQNGHMLPIVDSVKDAAVQSIKDSIVNTLHAFVDVIRDSSYSIALIGGGICVIIWAVTGVHRAGKAFGVIVLAYALIRFLLGG